MTREIANYCEVCPGVYKDVRLIEDGGVVTREVLTTMRGSDPFFLDKGTRQPKAAEVVDEMIKMAERCR